MKEFSYALIKGRDRGPVHRDENIARLDASLLCRRPCNDVCDKSGTRLCAANQNDSSPKGRRALADSRTGYK